MQLLPDRLNIAFATILSCMVPHIASAWATSRLLLIGTWCLHCLPPKEPWVSPQPASCQLSIYSLLQKAMSANVCQMSCMERAEGEELKKLLSPWMYDKADLLCIHSSAYSPLFLCHCTRQGLKTRKALLKFSTVVCPRKELSEAHRTTMHAAITVRSFLAIHFGQLVH